MEENLQVNQKLRSKYGIQVLLKWTSKERIWQPKTQTWYLVSAAVILLFIFVAVRLQAWPMFLALIAFMALWFISGYKEPWDVEHKVTTKGIYTFSKLFNWNEISHFWFARKEDQLLLYIDFPKESQQNRLTILVPDELEVDLFTILLDYLDYGNRKQAEYNVIAKLIYGEYMPISRYIADEDRLIE